MLRSSGTPGPVYVLHEYGAPSHFRALRYLERRNRISGLVFLEYRVIKQAAKALVYGDARWLGRACRNVKAILSLLSTKGERIVVCGAPYDPVIPLFRRLRELHRVVYFSSWPFWDGTKAVKKPFLPQQRRSWERFVSDVEAVTVTRKARRALRRLGARAHHIPHAVDTDLFRPGGQRKRSHLTRVLYVGQLEYRKGVDLLIDIYREHYRDRSDLEFEFVGKGPYGKRIKALASQQTNLRYDGYIQDVQQLAEVYRRADLLVLPSRKTSAWEELFGIVLIEAMASGLPVIATDCIGPLEIVRDGKFGWIARQGEKDHLLSRLDRLISSPDTVARMGKAARDEAVTRYDIRVLADRWEKLVIEA